MVRVSLASTPAATPSCSPRTTCSSTGRSPASRSSPDDYRGSEFCGAIFSLMGDVLFVNIQTPA
ncbi:MAG: hypothetical protein DIU71_01915 [Proteobacteria bacterium]|nr:MAG: hypothetical protein DIU71_01915 [Pseudomonadota bacterium]